MAKHPSPADWAKKYEKIANAATSGWNPLSALPDILQEEYPWLKEFVFGFFHDEETAERRMMGWEFLDPTWLEETNISDALGLRFGLIIKNGAVASGNMYIMIMAKDFREKVEQSRFDETEARLKSQLEGQKYVSPSDPRGQEYLESGAAEAKFEEHRVKTQPGEEVKRGPGRPRKT